MAGHCALTKCCGMHLYHATLISMIYVIIASIITFALTLLDYIDMKDTSWEMVGTFNADWRIHINDVMSWLDIIMMLAHLFICILGFLTFSVSKSEDTKLNVCMLYFFTISFSFYILIEFAVSMYFFTWMNHNIFILPYLCFQFFFWVLRTIMNIAVIFCTHSRIHDLKFQKKYDLLNMPGVNHSLSQASMLAGSMRSVAGQKMIKAMSSQRLYASRQSLANSQRSLNQSQRSLNQSQVSLNRGRGASLNV